MFSDENGKDGVETAATDAFDLMMHSRSSTPARIMVTFKLIIDKQSARRAGGVGVAQVIVPSISQNKDVDMRIPCAGRDVTPRLQAVPARHSSITDQHRQHTPSVGHISPA